MKKIFFILLVPVALYANSCRQVTEEDRENMAEEFYSRTHMTIVIENGLICDNEMFVNARKPLLDANICMSLIDSRGTEIAESPLLGGNYIVHSAYDEFGMLVESSEPKKTKTTCIDLYKEFKRKMNLNRK